jgi:hypothetical protein
VNDFDYDNLQKKRLARNAFARKGTRGRKGCRLPHENLTKKELEKMNGEVYSVNMNAPISWKSFKALTPNLQEDYLNHLTETHGVGICTIGKDMFGLSVKGLNGYVVKHNLKVNGHKGNIARATYEAWRKWLNGAPEEQPSPEPAEEEPVAEEPAPFRAHDYEERLNPVKTDDPPETANAFPLRDMSLTLKGAPNEVVSTLIKALPSLLDGEKTYRFTIKVDDYIV